MDKELNSFQLLTGGQKIFLFISLGSQMRNKIIFNIFEIVQWLRAWTNSNPGSTTC